MFIYYIKFAVDQKLTYTVVVFCDVGFSLFHCLESCEFESQVHQVSSDGPLSKAQIKPQLHR